MRFWKALSRLFSFFGWLLVIAGILATAAPLIENDQVKLVLTSFSEQTSDPIMKVVNTVVLYCLANHYLVFGVGVALALLALLMRRLSDRPYYDDFDDLEPEPEAKTDHEILPRPAYDPGRWTPQAMDEQAGPNGAENGIEPAQEASDAIPATGNTAQLVAKPDRLLPQAGTEAMERAAVLQPADAMAPAAPPAGEQGSLQDAYFSLLNYNNPQTTPPTREQPEAVGGGAGLQTREPAWQPVSDSVSQQEHEWNIPLTGGWADMAGELPPIDMSPWEEPEAQKISSPATEENQPAYAPYHGESLPYKPEVPAEEEPLAVTRSYEEKPEKKFTAYEQANDRLYETPVEEPPIAIRRDTFVEEEKVPAKAMDEQAQKPVASEQTITEKPVSLPLVAPPQPVRETGEEKPEEPEIVVKRTLTAAPVLNETEKPVERTDVSNEIVPEPRSQSARIRRASPEHEVVSAKRSLETEPTLPKPTCTVSMVGKTRIVTTIPNLHFNSEITPPTMLKGGLAIPKALPSLQKTEHPYIVSTIGNFDEEG